MKKIIIISIIGVLILASAVAIVMVLMNNTDPVTPDPTDTTQYTVNLPSGNAYTIETLSGSNIVEEGSSYSFRVIPTQDYIDDYIVVRIGGEIIDAQDGVYTVNNVLSDLSISIEGMVYKAPASQFNFANIIQGGNIVGLRILNSNVTNSSIILPSEVDGVPVISVGDNALGNNTTINFLVIPNSIKTIGNYSFFNTAISTVIIPKSLESIGNYAFASSLSLARIDYPDDVMLTSIGNYAFQNCDSLTEVIIPESVTSIGNNAFSHCDGLVNVTIESQAVTNSENLFMSCTNLVSATIKGDVTSIPIGMFKDCSSLSQVTIEEGVVNINDGAFINSTSLTSLTLPSTIEHINNNVFENSHIATITFNDGLKSIGNSAFYNTKLSSITIPVSVQTIGNLAFAICSHLSEVSFSSGSNLTSIGNSAFAGNHSVSGNLVGSGNLIEDIVLPNSLTSIGEYAFAYCDNLESVSIPGSVITISNYAFYLNNSLSSVTIGNGVRFIMNYVFADCGSLKSINLPSSLEAIGNRAFNNSALSSITIPANVNTIGDYSFANSSIASISFSASTVALTIGNYAFNQCSNITSITLPNRLVAMGNYAFANSSLTAITIPASLETIPNYSFFNCINLRNINIGNGVTRIGDYAFDNCVQLDSIDIPQSVNSIGARAFRNTRWQNTEVISNSHYDSITKLIIVNNILVHFRGGTQDTIVEVPEGVTRINAYAFENKTDIVRILLPVTVEEVGPYAFATCSKLTRITLNSATPPILGTFAFPTNLRSIVVEDTIVNLFTVDNTVSGWVQAYKNKVFSNALTFENGFIFNDHTLTLEGYEGIGGDLDIPQGIVTIGDNAFNDCDTITSITLPISVTTIGNYAFYDCNLLASVAIPSSVTSIGNYAFALCPNLETIDFQVESLLNTIGDYAFAGRVFDDELLIGERNKLATISLPENLNTIGEGAFMGSGLTSIVVPDNVSLLKDRVFSETNSLTSITTGTGINNISNYFAYNSLLLTSINIVSITSIGDYAFSRCLNLSNLIIPNTVTSIGKYAYAECSALDSVALSSALASIGEYAFNNCISLVSVILPESLTALGNNSFDGCVALANITLSSNLSDIEDGTFNGCHSLVNITLPSSVLSIGDYAFYDCINLVGINFPINLSGIGDYAFNNCDKLTNVVFNSNLMSIGDYAFNNCNSIASLVIPDSVMLIGNYAFNNITNLNSLTINDTSNLNQIGSYAFHNANKITSVNIPQGVVSIGSYAFALCSELGAVTFSGISNLLSIGEYAFAGAYYIEDIKYGNTNKLYDVQLPNSLEQIGNYAFYSSKFLNQLTLGNSLLIIGDYAFGECISLQDFSHPLSLYSIGEGAFYNCDSLVNVVVNAAVVGEKAFYDSMSIETVNVGRYVENIGEYAFGNLIALKSISVNALNTQYSNNNTDGVLFNKSRTTLIQYPSAKEAGLYVIPSSVTVISKYAFKNAYRLTTIEFDGSNTTTISEGAFMACNGLSRIAIPPSVTSIGDRAFFSCTSMTNIRFYSATPPMLGDEVFDNTPLSAIFVSSSTMMDDYKNTSVTGWSEELKLKVYEALQNIDGFLINSEGILVNYSGEGGDIDIPDEVIIINPDVFRNQNITGVTGGDNVISIGSNAFLGTEWLNSLTDTTEIGTVLIRYKNVQNAIVNNYITEIYDGAFENNYNLVSVDLPISLERIGNSAFFGCENLRNVIIPANVDYIGQFAFMNCKSLTGIFIEAITAPDIGQWLFEFTPLQAIYVNSVSEYKTKWSANSDMIYSNTIINNGYAIHNNNIVHYMGLGGDITIPSTVTTIKSYAFNMNNNITSITIPSNVISVESNAFNSCSRLSSLTFDALTPPSIGSNIYSNTNVIAVYVPDSAVNSYNSIANTGWNNNKVYSVSLLSNDFLIEDNILVHYLGNNQDVTIPDGVHTIGQYAFYGKSTIKTITIPQSVELINTNAFDKCTGIESFNVHHANNNYSSHNGVLMNNDQTELLKYPVGNAITDYTVPEYVVDITDYAFYKADNLINVTISHSVSRVGSYSFYGCANLTNLTIGGNVDVIDTFAFNSCNKLESVTFNDGVSEIRSRAFGNCISLTEIEIPGSVVSIGAYAFVNNRALNSVSIGENIQTIGEQAFFDCVNLNNVVIASIVVPTLGFNAFRYNNTGMGYIILPNLSIQVPNSSLTSYQSSSSWQDYSEYIMGQVT